MENYLTRQVVKLFKIELTSPIVAISVAIGFAFAGFAADVYVSETGTYRTDDGEDHEAYTDLQEALSASSTKNGDTVWIEDGFLCDSGSRDMHGPTRIVVEKKLTIRSRSGKWETGAEIRGAWHTETTMKGRNAIRCVSLGHGAEATFIGVRFTKGSISNTGDALSGGAVKTCGLNTHIKPCRLEKCLVAECYGRCLSAQEGVPMTVVDCVMTNNSTGVAVGASLYDCRVEGNYGNGSYTIGTEGNAIVVSNCVVRNNSTSGSNSTAGLYASSIDKLRVFDTKIIGNANMHNIGGGAAARGYGVYEHCEVAGNVCGCSGNGGLCSAAVGGIVLNRCIVTNNLAGQSYGAGEYLVATNTLFAYNIASNGCAGVKSSNLYGCRIIGNKVASMAAAERAAGGAHSCFLEKCLIADNVCTNKGTKASEAGWGGGAYKSTLVDCVVSNCFAGSGGGAYDCVLVNTPVVDCRAFFNGGGVYGGAATNCEIRGNFAGRSLTDDSKSGYGGGTYNAELVHCVVSNNACVYRGGGVCGTDTRNCLISDNRQLGEGAGFGSVNHGGGGGAWNGLYYNCLITRNESAAEYGGPIGSYNTACCFYNCTVMGNTSTGTYSTPAGLNSQAVNSILAGNVSTYAKAADSYDWASNSVVTVKTGKYGRSLAEMGCVICDDPETKKIRNSGLVFDWMTDLDDVRSKDLAGNDRWMGSGPDMGCFERKIPGLLLMVR